MSKWRGGRHPEKPADEFLRLWLTLGVFVVETTEAGQLCHGATTTVSHVTKGHESSWFLLRTACFVLPRLTARTQGDFKLVQAAPDS